jgi:hypothetical protein
MRGSFATHLEDYPLRFSVILDPATTITITNDETRLTNYRLALIDDVSIKSTNFQASKGYIPSGNRDKSRTNSDDSLHSWWLSQALLGFWMNCELGATPIARDPNQSDDRLTGADIWYTSGSRSDQMSSHRPAPLVGRIFWLLWRLSRPAPTVLYMPTVIDLHLHLFLLLSPC